MRSEIRLSSKACFALKKSGWNQNTCYKPRKRLWIFAKIKNTKKIPGGKNEQTNI